MLDNTTKRRIDNARDILVGKVPDPKAQVEQITTALIYKFMFDMDQESVELGGEPAFFVGEYDQYAWSKLMDKRLGGHARLDLYVRAITSMSQNPHIPQLFRDIFKGAFLPYRDPETLNLFLKEIDVFTYDHSERLGDAFEYLLSILGSQGAAGQFRTPRHIIDFIVAAVGPNKTDTILDPACGTAGFLISAYKYILASNQDTPLTPDERQRLTENFVGYDIAPEMVRLSLVNMYLHKFPQPTIYEYDTLTSEDRWDDTFDVILANPPFMTPKGGIRPHNRFSVQTNRSEVLFVDYIAEHLIPTGRAGVIVPEGIIFQSSNAYKALRKMLIAENYLWAVISLPAGVFNPYSGVKTSILLMDKTLARRTDRVLFIDVKNDGYDLGAQRRDIDQNDLPKALNLLLQFQTDPTLEFDTPMALTVPKTRIVENGEYNITSSRYRDVIRAENLRWPLLPLFEVAITFLDGDWIERKDQSADGIRLIQTGNVGEGEYLDKPDNARFISEDTFHRLQCTEVFPGDILISRLPDPVGRACIVPDLGTRAITAVDCTIVRFDETRVLAKYFLYLATTLGYFDGLVPYLTGAIRKRISRKNLGLVQIPIPPLDVQRALIAEIESYQAIITGARQVLASYSPRIPIDPAWPLVELEKICEDILSGGTPSTKNPAYWTGEIPWITSADIVDLRTATPRRYITEIAIAETAANLIPKNNVIEVTRVSLGKLFRNDFDVCISQDSQGLILDRSRINPDYLTYVLYPLVQRFKDNSQGTTIQGVTKKQLKSIKIPLPSLETQQVLVAQIDEEQSLVAANQQLIEIFQSKIDAAIACVWGEEPIS